MAIASVEFSYKEKQKMDRTFEVIKKEIPAATYEALVAFLFGVKALAQNRLKDRKHIVKSRLRNSIYVHSTAKRQDNKTYSDNEGKTYSAVLAVPLKKHEAAIGTNVEYALSVERGSSPHVILPKNKPLLKWKDKLTGQWRSAKKVNHPGTQGDSYLWWAFHRADDKEFVKAYNKEVNMIKKKIQ
jgi:hypothetical protein